MKSFVNFLENKQGLRWARNKFESYYYQKRPLLEHVVAESRKELASSTAGFRRWAMRCTGVKSNQVESMDGQVESKEGFEVL